MVVSYLGYDWLVDPPDASGNSWDVQFDSSRPEYEGCTRVISGKQRASIIKKAKKKMKEEYSFVVSSMTVQDLIRAKDSLKKNNGSLSYLDCNMETIINPPLAVSPKKEKNMCYKCEHDCDEFEASPRSDEAQTKEYLVMRLWKEACNKHDAAYTNFNIIDDPSPTDGEELVKRITSGKYVLDLEAIKAAKKNPYFVSKATLGITWSDPTKSADKDGFDAYVAKVNAAQQASEDIIRISSPADGLKELNAFKAATF